MEFLVHILFDGNVAVTVPDNVELKIAKRVAERKALAMMLAVSDNPDAPEDQACSELIRELNAEGEPLETAIEDIWDRTEVAGIGGRWTAEYTEEVKDE